MQPRNPRANILLAAAYATALLAVPALAADGLRVPADVLRVYDGDTFYAIAHPWPGVSVETAVRVDGVDTPEMRGRCQAESDAAILARNRAAALLGERVMLAEPDHGKYAGRVVARVLLADGRDLADVLIGEGLGRPYDGGKREGWCD